MTKMYKAVSTYLMAVSALSAGNAFSNSSVSFTYNDIGKVVSIDGPRIDVSDVVNYEYDTNGNRVSVTNALGHKIRFLDFNNLGLPNRIVDANGTETFLVYHVRGWLLTSTVKDPSGNNTNDATTKYDYDAVGQLIKTTQADGVELIYEYDDARRLVAVSNNQSERIEYTLDVAGNRTGEVIKNSNGEIKKSLSRTFDELNRVIGLIGASGQTTSFGYDVNSNQTQIVDGRTNPTDQSYDALNRLKQVVDANNDAADYAYDDLDRLVGVTDPRGLQTHYSYDAYDNLTELVSPDTGITNMQYDEAGNLIERTDANGVVTQFSYDALNRLTAVIYPASTGQNLTYTYDQTDNGNKGIGRLTEVVEPAGKTAYHYDHRGNVVTVTSELDQQIYSTVYTYDGANNLSSIGYPSGRTVSIVRDTQGRISNVVTKAAGDTAGEVVASNFSYLPFGPLAGFSYGNGTTATLSYDKDYRLTGLFTQAEGLTLQDKQYQYDNAGNITQIDDLNDSTRNQVYGYDKINRITDANGVYGDIDYTYDAVGNRTKRDIVKGTDTVNETYVYATGSQRLLSVDSTVNATPEVQRRLVYDDNGNLIKDIRKDGSIYDYSYDDNNRLTDVEKNGQPVAGYLYNSKGQRVLKLLAGNPVAAIHYHYDLNGQLIAESNGSGELLREYVYADGLRIAMIAAVETTVITPESLTLDSESEGEATGNWKISTSISGYHGGNYLAHPANGPVQGGLIVDNSDVNFSVTGTWKTSTAISGYNGSNYLAHAANGLPPEALLIDNDQANFTGAWKVSTSVRGYEGANYHAHAAGTGESSATWSSQITPGEYTVYARWTQHANRASDATYRISYTDDQQQTQQQSVTVDQQSQGGEWQSLGNYHLTNDIYVTLANDADGYVIADAIMVVPTNAEPNTATWTLSVPEDGDYYLDLRWTAHPNRATNALYNIVHTDHESQLATAISYIADQQQNGGEWQRAQAFTLKANDTLRVSLSDQANGYVIADAVRLLSQDAEANQFSWPLNVSQPGDYILKARWTQHANRATNATYHVQHVNGFSDISVNQQINGGDWQILGTFSLDANSQVTLTDKADGYVIADAIQIEWADTPENQQLLDVRGHGEPEIFYIQNDHLGTPQVMSDANQQIAWAADYTPFGETVLTASAIENPLRFPGQYEDAETGLYYNYYRDYDPTLGRYIQSDPIGLRGGLNTYAYVGGNPIKRIDRFGLDYFSEESATNAALNRAITEARNNNDGPQGSLVFENPPSWLEANLFGHPKGANFDITNPLRQTVEMCSTVIRGSFDPIHGSNLDGLVAGAAAFPSKSGWSLEQAQNQAQWMADTLNVPVHWNFGSNFGIANPSK